MANQKLTFEVSAEAVNVDQVKKKIKSIDDEITKLQKHAKDIRVSDKGGSEIGKELIKGIEDSISELKSIQKNYTNILDSISNKKIDTKQFENFANTVNTRLEVVEQRVVSLEESLTKLVSRFEKKISTQVIEKQIASLRGEFDTFTSSAQEAIKILSSFESMVNATTSKPKETKIKVDTSELEKVEGLIKRFESDSFLGGKSGLTIRTDSAVKNLNNLYEKYQYLSSELSKTKDSKQISSLQVQLAELLPELAQVTNRIIELKKLDINSLEDGSIGKISIGEIDDFAKVFDFIQNEIGITSNRLADMRNNMRAALSSVTEEATTEVSQFTFKKGGIRVPVTIDAKSQSSLETKYNELVSALQGYADLHPVNVTMRLFPLNTNRAGADEITSVMRNIQTDINSVQDEGLKTKLNSLYDDLEAQFKKALDLKIKVDLGDTQIAKKRIKDLQEEVKKQGFTIYPTFDISADEAKKITGILAKVQDGLTLNFNDKLQKTADALNKLISNGNISKWSDQFAEGLGKAYDKLEEMQPLIQTLTFFFATKKTAKDSIISKSDITAVTNFANAINNLQEIIEKIQKVDLTKLDTKGFGKKLQAELGDMEPVIIPIEPDLSSITSFVSKIEDALNKANINLKPSAGSKTLRDYVQDDNIAKSMYLDMYKGLDAVADNVGTPLKKKIAESLVGGLRKGMSSVSDILRQGLKGTKFESITEELVGDKETLDEIKNVANKIGVEYQKALGESEINVGDFIGNIESQILSSGKKVRIPITLLEGSIDEFLKEIQTSISSQKGNVNDNNITNISNQVNSIWDIWITSVKDATNAANKSIDSVIAKLGILANTLNNISKLDFTKNINDINNLISQRPSDSIGNIISQMMSADSLMYEARGKKSLRERAFYYNSKTQQHTNTYVTDKNTSFGLKREILKQTPGTYDTHVHTHPEKYATMSLAIANKDIDGKIKNISGDILTFFYDYLDGIETQIIAAQDNVQVFDAKRFYDDYLNIFSNKKGNLKRGLPTQLFNAKNKKLAEFINNKDNLVSILENSNVNYSDLFKGNTRDIFSEAADLLGTRGAKSAYIALMQRFGIKGLEEGGILTSYLNDIKNGYKVDLKSFLRRSINENGYSKTKSFTDNTPIPNLEEDIYKYLDTVVKTFNLRFQENFRQQIIDQLTPDILKEIGVNNFEDYYERIPIEEFRERYGDVAGVTDQTTQSAQQAAEAIKEEGVAAEQSAILKQKFAEANKEVASSAEKTASETKNAAEGLKAEGKAGEENKDKLSESEINEMANKREQATAKRIQEEEKAARAQGNAINKEQERQYKEQQKLQEKARQEEEKARQEMDAALLKTQESRRKAEEKAFNAQSAAINKEQERQYNQQVKEQEKRNNQLANFQSGFSVKRNDIQFEIDKGGHTKEFETRLQDIISKIDAINAKSIDAVTEQDIKDAQALSEEIRIIQKSGKLTANKSANENSVQKTLSQINSILSGNTKSSFKQTDVYNDLITLQKAFQNFDTSRPQSELAELSTEFLRTKARFDELDDTVKGENFFQTVIGRLQKSNAQLIATYFSWMDMIRYARQAIDTIRDLDTQMVELAKVSEQSLDQIKGDFSSYSTVAKNLGATISDTISATADWARLGYNVPDAKELSRVALLYKNVGDGIDINAANESLISTLQGYQMQADEAEHIVDVFNEVYS